MSQWVSGRCLRCGRPEEGERTHCVCGASLLVDVVLKTPCPPERERFQIARALAPLGAPVPPFAELRKDLSREDGQVVRGVSQVFARQVLEVLATQGALAELRPTKSTGASAGWVPRVLGGVALAMCLMGVGAVVAIRSPSARPVAVPEPPAPVVEAVGPPVLTTQELSQRALPSTVSLRCESSTGSGFFVTEEVVLTNAHVACPVGKVMEVTLSDGRRVLGQTLERDEALDLATVRVSGERAEPLPLGDATLLSPGDKLVFIGSPKGLSFTVHEGKTSHLGREYLGVGYVQFDASVNPGNSGGPLFNERGEVVGVVSLKVTHAEGIGLALPIQYAGKYVALPRTPQAEQRWTALLDRVEREEERELKRYRMEPYTPALMSLEDDERVGLVVVLVEKLPAGATRRYHHFQIQSGTDTCQMNVTFDQWRALQESPDDADDSRRLRWLRARGVTEALYVGVARLPVESCTLPAQGQGELSVSRGNPEVSRTKVDLSRVARARELGTARRPVTQSLSNYGSRGSSQASQEPGYPYDREQWQSAFQKAHSAMAELETARRKYEQEYARGDASARSTIDEIDRRLKRGRAYLDDLDRQASSLGIPREWRR